MMKIIYRMFVELAWPYWKDKKNWRSWLLLAAIICLGFILAAINIKVNTWSKDFYNAIGDFKIELLYGLSFEYCGYITILVLTVAYRGWLIKLLILRWRQTLTDQLIHHWLSKKAFYRLALTDSIDNPDQRIAEDINLFIQKTISLVISFIFNFTQLWAFLLILGELSGEQTFSLLGYSFIIKGYLIWAVIIYTLLGTIITHLIGRKLHSLNYEQQHQEANFRGSLLRKFDDAEQIALYGGEAKEAENLRQHFASIANNWLALMNRERNLNFFTLSHDRLQRILPIFIALPAFMAKTITLGSLMQIKSAFGAVYNSLGWFIFAYQTLAEWSATLQRLNQFKQAILEQQQQNDVRFSDQITLEKLTVCTPKNEILLKNITLTVPRNTWFRFLGASGLGKSTLLRVLAGLWPYYHGNWSHQKGTTLFLPQKTYLSHGSLAEILSYPSLTTASEERLNKSLIEVGLDKWLGQLQYRCDWDKVFSVGERQRIAFARALITQPDVLFMDEPTSSLDAPSSLQLLQLLKRELKNTTVIAITHQNEFNYLFENYHNLSDNH